MGKKFVDGRQFAELARRNEAGGARVIVVTTAAPKAAADGSRKIRFVFSDGTIDRAGDTIAVDGWELASFKRNPVALWAHDSSSPPVGRASNVGKVGQRLVGDIEFAAADQYPFADTIYRLTAGGFINAVSVGFNPLEWSFTSDPQRPLGIDFKRQELLEISLCPVPCNENALATARANGIDTTPVAKWAEQELDGRRDLYRRAALEDLRKAASGVLSRSDAIRKVKVLDRVGRLVDQGFSIESARRMAEMEVR